MTKRLIICGLNVFSYVTALIGNGLRTFLCVLTASLRCFRISYDFWKFDKSSNSYDNMTPNQWHSEFYIFHVFLIGCCDQ